MSISSFIKNYIFKSSKGSSLKNEIVNPQNTIDSKKVKTEQDIKRFCLNAFNQHQTNANNYTIFTEKDYLLQVFCKEKVSKESKLGQTSIVILLLDQHDKIIIPSNIYYIYNNCNNVIIFVLRENLKLNKIDKLIDNSKKYKNVTVFIIESYPIISELIKIISSTVTTDYISFYTFNYIIDHNSYLNEVNKYINQFSPDLLISSIYKTLDSHILGTNDIGYEQLANVTIKTSLLKNIRTSNLNFVNDILITFEQQQLNTHFLYNDYFYKINTNNIYSVANLTKLAFNIQLYLKENLLDKDLNHKILDIISTIKYIRCNYYLTDFRFSLLAIISAYACYYCEINNFDIEWAKEEFARIFDFDTKIIQKSVIDNINFAIDILQPIKKTDILIIETIGMEEIKNSVLFDLLKKKWNIHHISKKMYFNYYNFNNIVLRLHTASSKLVLASGSLNRNMLSDNTQLLTLWHGLGWMKKTIVNPKKFTVGTIVCSSEFCASHYKEHFQSLNALPLGSVQTDILFDKEWASEARNKLIKEYNLSKNTIIAFFAPTYRLSSGGEYYNPMFDIDEFGILLKQENIFVIAKSHHIFYQILRNTGKDRSGLYTSQNRQFVVSEGKTFAELIAGSDILITDYSSGMFHAFATNKAVVLYAPDLNEYKDSAQGLEIDYPDAVPAPFVGTPNIKLLIDAIKKSKDFVNTDKYKLFKRLHVGKCDGHASERVIEYISEVICRAK